MELRTISAEEVLQIHETLVADFSRSLDPISPPGLRSVDLLQSAVGRQFTGLGGVLKYPDPIDNAATVLYGLCNDHPFHNGNKRTALVATLAHLEKNKLALFNTKQNELFDLMLKVASHTLFGKPSKRAKRPKRTPAADLEVQKIAHWLRQRADRVMRGERQITYREMRHILERFGYYFERPKNNSIDIVKYVNEKRGWLNRKVVRVRKHIGTAPWPGELREMGIKDIKHIRQLCRLREEDGIDSDAFYDEQAIIDTFVNRYRTLLRRLAKV